MPIYSGSSVIAIKWEGQYRFYAVAILAFYILQVTDLKRSHIFFKHISQYLISNTTVKVTHLHTVGILMIGDLKELTLEDILMA
jgi:hypothetical protein